MKIVSLMRKNALPLIAILVATISIFFVPFDEQYLNYIDVRTLACLFITMLILCAFRNIRTFRFVAQKLVSNIKNTRLLVACLIFVTFAFSAFIANDMALLTFLPLTLITLKLAGLEKYTAFTIAMQNIAANLGGMITPFGNPQNLYLFNKFNINIGEFFSILALPYLLGFALLIGCCFLVKAAPVKENIEPNITLDKRRVIIYFALFIVAVFLIFRSFDLPTTLMLIGVLTLIITVLDKKAFAGVDYGLLITFTAFFIFAGNLARIPSVHQVVSALVEKSVYLTALVSCQFMSNVPTAIFISNFTTNYSQLLHAVNIGGLGTLIASLASLISFNIFCKEYPREKGKYLLIFTLLNFAILLILSLVTLLILY